MLVAYGYFMFRFVLTLVVIARLSQLALAVPCLQLDVSGGQYDSSTESIVNTTNEFSLYALANLGDSKLKGASLFHLAVAITPKQDFSPTGLPKFGSFTIDGKEYSDARPGDFGYGTPSANGAFLQEHGIYPTYFFQLSFNSFAGKATAYNTEDSPGAFSANPLGALSYKEFLVDVSEMNQGYELHFDLFTATTVGKKKQVHVQLVKAPFSHDVSSIAPVPCPEGGSTLASLALALGTVGFFHRKFARRISSAA